MRSGDFVSPDDPPLRLRPDASWRYLGTADFDLEHIAHVERHHFVVADGARLTRMLVLQFENILPGVDEIYRWEVRTPRELAGIPYQFNVFAFDADEAARERPGAEVAHTAQFLREHGLAMEGERISVRLARVVGVDRKRELILFHYEPLSASGVTLAEVLDGKGEIRKEYQPLIDDVTERALASFSVLPEPGSVLPSSHSQP